MERTALGRVGAGVAAALVQGRLSLTVAQAEVVAGVRQQQAHGVGVAEVAGPHHGGAALWVLPVHVKGRLPQQQSQCSRGSEAGGDVQGRLSVL